MFGTTGAGSLSSSSASISIPTIPSSSSLGHTIVSNQHHHVSTSVHRQQISERLHAWIKEEAAFILDNYTGTKGMLFGASSNVDILERLAMIATQLVIKDRDVGCEPLNALKSILLERDISAFQWNHSGLPSALNTYLTDTNELQPPRKLRLRRFAAVFLMLTV